jgi:hypothetical protein
MTLNKRSIKKLQESMWVWFTAEQEQIILERFSEEPYPYEWSEQDISEQIDRILLDHPRPPLPEPDFLK